MPVCVCHPQRITRSWNKLTSIKVGTTYVCTYDTEDLPLYARKPDSDFFFAFHNTQNLTWEFARYEAIMKSHTISDVKKALHTNFLHFTLRPYSFSTTPILRMIFFCKHDVQTHSSLSPHCHWHSNLLPISAPLSSTHSTCHPSPSTHSWLVAIQWKGLRGMT